MGMYGSRYQQSDPEWIWVLSLLAGIGLLIYGLIAGFHEIQFRGSGKVATAHVTGTWYSSSTSKSGQSHSFTHTDFEYKANGKSFDGSMEGSFPPDFPIEYIESDPTIRRLPDQTWAPWGPAALIASLVLIGLGIYRFFRNDELMED